MWGATVVNTSRELPMCGKSLRFFARISFVAAIAASMSSLKMSHFKPFNLAISGLLHTGTHTHTRTMQCASIREACKRHASILEACMSPIRCMHANTCTCMQLRARLPCEETLIREASFVILVFKFLYPSSKGFHRNTFAWNMDKFPALDEVSLEVSW